MVKMQTNFKSNNKNKHLYEASNDFFDEERDYNELDYLLEINSNSNLYGERNYVNE